MQALFISSRVLRPSYPKDFGFATTSHFTTVLI